MIKTTDPIAGVDEGGFYLLFTFSNKEPQQVREMLQMLEDPEGRAIVEHYDDNVVEVKIRPDLPGL